jgi:hypothetical protein
MKIFEFDDYKTWLLQALQEKSKIKSGQQSALAQALNCKPA